MGQRCPWKSCFPGVWLQLGQSPCQSTEASETDPTWCEGSYEGGEGSLYDWNHESNDERSMAATMGIWANLYKYRLMRKEKVPSKRIIDQLSERLQICSWLMPLSVRIEWLWVNFPQRWAVCWIGCRESGILTRWWGFKSICGRNRAFTGGERHSLVSYIDNINWDMALETNWVAWWSEGHIRTVSIQVAETTEFRFMGTHSEGKVDSSITTELGLWWGEGC